MNCRLPVSFRQNSLKSLDDLVLREAVRKSTNLLSSKRSQGLESVPLDQWRERASDIRKQTILQLPEYVDTFSRHATAAGAVVHRAVDARRAADTIYYILKDRHASQVVKAKSMITEEICLNEFLEDRGIHVVETDLGEFIIQLAGESPSHILGPAIHKTRQQVGKLFADKLGVAFSDKPELLTKIARQKLREKFLCADAGITGANFAVAETGTVALFTNEGNGRMVTTIPPIHIAVLSVEKIIASLADLGLFASLLPRSATGQPLSSYLSLITGTRKPNETTGARELHIVLLDNGRSEIAVGQHSDILKCIRCSACINVCPVYGTVGGHAYDSPYSGPMGIVLTILLKGMAQYDTLLDACTLCGACVEICPVKVPLKEMIRSLREKRIKNQLTSPGERFGIKLFGNLVGHTRLFDYARKTCKQLWPVLVRISRNQGINRLPAPTGSGTRIYESASESTRASIG